MRAYDEIAKIAYEFCEKSGKTNDPDLDMWLEAERIVMRRYMEQETAVGSFPSSAKERSLPIKTGMPHSSQNLFKDTF